MSVALAHAARLPERRLWLPRLSLGLALVGPPVVTAVLLKQSLHDGVAFVVCLYMVLLGLAQPVLLLAGFLAQLPLVPRWGHLLGVRVPDLMTPLALVLAGSALLRWLAVKDRAPLKVVWLDLLVPALLLLGRLDLYRGPAETDLAKAYTRMVLVPALFYVAARLLLLGRARVRSLLVLQLLAGVGFAVIVIVEAALHQSFLYRSVSGTFNVGGLYQPGGAFGVPFLMGAYLSMLLPLYLYGSVGGFGRRWRGVCTAGALLAVAGVGLSMERGAWLAAAAALAVCLLSRPLRARAMLMVGLAVALVALGLVVTDRSWVKSRVTERANVGDRMRFLQAGIGIVQSPEWNPLLGIGYGGYAAIAYRYMPPRSYFDVDRSTEADRSRAMHNDYARTVVEHGLPAAGLLLLIILSLARRSAALMRNRGRAYDAPLATALAAALASVLVSAATHNTFAESQLMSVFWVYCAFLFGDTALAVGEDTSSKRRRWHRVSSA